MALPNILNVGVVGLGRLGSLYARHFHSRIAGARLHSVYDVRFEAARAIASEIPGVAAHRDAAALLADPGLDAVVITTPTKFHGEGVIAAAKAGKAIFCEKPLTLDEQEGRRMEAAVAESKVFFQLGFMRRFDPAYAAAKRKIMEGAIGTPVVFKSASRDQFPPPIEYLNPVNSGGLFIDMGIHDFDLARWFMGEVRTVYGAGGALAYPEIGGVGDVDNAVATLQCADGRLGIISLSRNGVYGYAIDTEIVGTKGTIRIGYDRHTPILVLQQNAVTHDTVPGFQERFEQAYLLQLQNFVDNVRGGRPSPIVCADGLAALKLAAAATRSLHSGRPEPV